jgi:hypothetical protein
MKNLKTIAIALVIAFGTTLATAQTKKINVEKSTINWVGKKVTGEHSGTVNLKEGNLKIIKLIILYFHHKIKCTARDIFDL